MKTIRKWLFSQQFIQFRLVESHQYLVVNRDYRHTHLPRYFNHFLHLFPVGGDIVILEDVTLLRKILLRSMAVGSGWCRIDDNTLFSHGFTSVSTHNIGQFYKSTLRRLMHRVSIV